MTFTFPWQYIFILYYTQFYKQISSNVPKISFTTGLFLREFISEVHTSFDIHVFSAAFTLANHF